MSLGALSLVDSGGVVLSSGSAMQPVNTNTGSQLQKMSPIDSMKEVFFDIRDGIGNLGSIFSDKIGGLNKHLAFRLETLNNTMSNIGNIAAKDLGLEQIQTNIDIENEKDEDRDNSLRDEKKTSPGMLDALKNAFDGFVDKIQNSEVLKAGLFGLLALALFTQIDKVSKIFTEVFRFISETVIPNLKELNKIIQDSPSGYLGLGGAILAITTLFKGLRSVVAGVGVFIATISRPLAAIGRFLRGSVRILSKVISPLLKIIPGLGILGAFAKTLGPIGLAIQVIIGAFTFVNEFIKSWKAEGDLMTALGAGLIGVYDVLIGATLNLLADLGGFIVKKLGFENIGQSIQDMDFSFDSIMTGIENLKNSISDYFYNLIGRLRNKVPKALGGTKGSVFVPRYTEKKVSKADAKQMTAGNSLPPSMRGGAESADGFYQRKGRIDVIPLGDNAISSKIDEFNSQDLVIDTKTANMLAKNKTLIAESKRLDSEMKEPAKGNNVYMDNKQVTGGTTVNNSRTTVGNQRVESTDRATRELNAVYGYAIA